MPIGYSFLCDFQYFIMGYGSEPYNDIYILYPIASSAFFNSGVDRQAEREKMVEALEAVL